ncbi:MAG: phospholipid carrier-dependent glycosyltransferase [Gemmataceae bacterium]|nr:phospholipid carrier-dependent glycosyltransferase [Gemmataceae bacterium]
MNLRNVLALAAVTLLLGWFWTRGEQFFRANGPTFDEGVHLAAGYSYWTTGRFELNREDPPLLKLLWALPVVLGDGPPYPINTARETNNDHWAVANALLYNSGRAPGELLTPARRVNLVVGCAVALLAGWWAFRLWGSRLAGVGAVGFAVADPSLLALSCVLSTDAGLTLLALLACYLAWEYAAAPSRVLLYALGIALGLALATKFSSLAVVLGLGAAGVVFVLRGGVLALPGAPSSGSRWPALWQLAVRLGFVALVTLAATYGFVHFGQWGGGLKFQLTRAEHGDGVMYFCGQLAREGFYSYFLAVLPLKLTLGLMAAVLVVLATRRWAGASRLAFLVVPPLVFFALASYSRVNLGVRVVLPVVPFLCVFAAGLACGACCRTAGYSLLAICVAWAGVSASRSDPHPLAYFNEAVGGPRGGAAVAADSNLDWGQGLPALKAHLDANGPEVVYLSYFGTDRPEAYGIRFAPLPTYGRIGDPGGEVIPERAPRHVLVISINNVLGIYLNDPDTFAFLRDREPNDVIAGGLYVFDLTGDPDRLRRIRALTLK